MIDDLDHQTQNLENKKKIEEKVNTTLQDVRENISDLLFVKNQDSRYFREMLEDKLSKIEHDLEVLKSGGRIDLSSMQ